MGNIQAIYQWRGTVIIIKWGEYSVGLQHVDHWRIGINQIGNNSKATYQAITHFFL